MLRTTEDHYCNIYYSKNYDNQRYVGMRDASWTQLLMYIKFNHRGQLHRGQQYKQRDFWHIYWNHLSRTLPYISWIVFNIINLNFISIGLHALSICSPTALLRDPLRVTLAALALLCCYRRIMGYPEKQRCLVNHIY